MFENSQQIQQIPQIFQTLFAIHKHNQQRQRGILAHRQQISILKPNKIVDSLLKGQYSPSFVKQSSSIQVKKISHNKNLLNKNVLNDYVQKLVNEYDIEYISDDAMTLISQLVRARLVHVLQALSVLSKHRVELNKLNYNFTYTSKPRQILVKYEQTLPNALPITKIPNNESSITPPSISTRQLPTLKNVVQSEKDNLQQEALKAALEGINTSTQFNFDSAMEHPTQSLPTVTTKTKQNIFSSNDKQKEITDDPLIKKEITDDPLIKNRKITVEDLKCFLEIEEEQGYNVSNVLYKVLLR